jgi:hypothetical protein
MKRVLMIAFHFPPLTGSSGIQRTLRFAQQLPAFGWSPIVLSAHPRAYERTSDDLLSEIPPEVVVRRAFALDAARHLALHGRYPGRLASPDRWMTWRIGAVPAGLDLIREHRPRALWSTFPIATAHVIGATLAQRSGLPWIADFRDPMVQPGYPALRHAFSSFKSVEERSLQDARFSVFTSPGAAVEYKRRYPRAADRIAVVENGYDEESFAGIARHGTGAHALRPGVITLLHSGVVYPVERDPTQLFAAIACLAAQGELQPDKVAIRFRAATHDDMLRAVARRHGVESFIEILPPISYRAALEEMLSADGLLVLQGADCSAQIPAKLYEYLRARRPILALTDPCGDTAGVLRSAGLDSIARLDSADEIAARLGTFVEAIRLGRAQLPDAGYMAGATRLMRARQLAELLDRASASH